jgi:adenosylcobinamide-phosphate synthase
MELTPHLLLVLAACIGDGLFGDPVYRLHPVRLLGAWSERIESTLFALGLAGHVGGVLHWLLVVGTALGGWWSIHALLGQWQPWAAWAWDLFIAYSLLCLRDLLDQARHVRDRLDDIDAARERLTRLVSRDTRALDRPGVVRATIESLAENLTDGVLTPLWALCLFGLPGLVLVKAVSTLDSMVGYRSQRHRRFGWIAARADDLVHWLPARLSVAVIALAAALLRLHPREAVGSALRWHAVSDSPNSGWSEAAMAGALRVRLLGPIRYRGEIVNQAFIGDPAWPADPDRDHLHQAWRLALVAGLLAIGLGLVMASAAG